MTAMAFTGGRTSSNRVVMCLEVPEMGYDFATRYSWCDYYIQNKALIMKALRPPILSSPRYGDALGCTKLVISTMAAVWATAISL